MGKFYLFNQSTGEFLPIRDGTICGRTGGDLNFPHDGVLSRRHCQFIVSGTDAFLLDLSSTNKTKLNNVAIQPKFKRRLHMNDVIEFGRQRFVFTNQNVHKPGHVQDVIEIDGRMSVRRIGGGNVVTTEPQKDAPTSTQILVDRRAFNRIKLQETVQKIAPSLASAKPTLPECVGVGERKGAFSSSRIAMIAAVLCLVLGFAGGSGYVLRNSGVERAPASSASKSAKADEPNKLPEWVQNISIEMPHVAHEISMVQH